MSTPGVLVSVKASPDHSIDLNELSGNADLSEVLGHLLKNNSKKSADSIQHKDGKVFLEFSDASAKVKGN